MDYTTESLSFKVRKALRYVRLYGPRRTWVKIKSQYRAHKRYNPLPPLPEPAPSGGHVGLIGCGAFAYGAIAYYLAKNRAGSMRGAMDVDLHRAASLWETYGLRYYTDDPARILEDPEIDLVYVASNHASHAEYAVRSLRAGKAVHIEKPHCVNEEQLRELCATLVETGGKACLGFNRPTSRLGTMVREALEAEDGALMMNWFVAGHKIDPEHWYFHEREGGRILGNLCHWTDFVYRMVPAERRFPITITPTRAEASDSDIAVTYTFADGSIAAITFSAKGHTFEGVRERFAAHRGSTLISLDDFKDLRIEAGHDKRVVRPTFRDHGHEQQILRSYAMAKPGKPGEPVSYVWETGLLFLETKRALEENRIRVIRGFDESF